MYNALVEAELNRRLLDSNQATMIKLLWTHGTRVSR